ncbi:uncharacterized protein LOC130799401 [Amaranthus tricolor]|uniref:uncharacterized protein LOC130799401 n=1 Tax=Amaranthus tricolor TaxID=29722 RepID=UPI00258BA010|nr:uncharacterized protein LOC130799401 [Amaranthus tricolor]
MTGGLEKLNYNNYTYWSTCIESYLQGQDLWEVVGGCNTILPEPKIVTVDSDKESTVVENEAFRRWNIKADKAMYVLKTTIDKELVEYIRKAETPKVAWDTLATLFSKKNDARLQMLESELMTISQGDLTINQYFKKVKSLCSEIAELDPEEKISEQCIRRIIAHGLRHEFNGFMAAIRGWLTQPTLLELENMLANQEALTRQITGVSPRKEEEALFGGQKKDRHNNMSKPNVKGKPGQQWKPNQGRKASGGAQTQSQKMTIKKIVATTASQEQTTQESSDNEKTWDAEAAVAIASSQVEENEEVVLAVVPKEEKINYRSDWIIDSGCSNYMTRDVQKLEDLEKYKGNQVIATANNSKLPIRYVGKTKVIPGPNYTPVQLKDVFHVPGPNSGCYVLFGPQEVRVQERQ